MRLTRHRALLAPPRMAALSLALTTCAVALLTPATPATARDISQATDATAEDKGEPGKISDFSASYPMGSIVIVNNERKLYYVLGGDMAIAYPIAIGTRDEIWTGRTFVQSKIKDPTWKPPWAPGEEIPAGPENPLGPRALYLDWSLYRIHGTNAPGSIGRSASHGCFRMHNKHVKDLFERVHVGAPVYVIDDIDDPVPEPRRDKPTGEKS